MRISDFFPSQYMRVTDLGGQRRTVTIEGFKVEKIGDKEKPILSLRKVAKALVLNKTNALAIAGVLGTEDPQQWIGGRIVLRPDRVTFKGQMVDAIRVEAPAAQPAAAPAPAPTAVFEEEDPFPIEDPTDWGGE